MLRVRGPRGFFLDGLVTKDKVPNSDAALARLGAKIKPAQVTYACEQYKILNTTQYVKRADGAAVNETTFNRGIH